MTELKLVNLILGEEYVRALAKSFKVLPKLELIELAENNVDDRLYSIVLKGLLADSFNLKKIIYRG